MIELYADKASLSVTRRELITSGSVGAYRVKFQFSQDWEGLERVAVFRAGDRSVSVLLDGAGECDVPWEVLGLPNRRLMAGVYGTSGGTLVLPTVWADCGAILEGVSPGETTRPPTPGPFEQVLAQLAEKQDVLTGRPGQVVGFDQDGSAVAQNPAAASSATVEEVEEMLNEVFG